MMTANSSDLLFLLFLKALWFLMGLTLPALPLSTLNDPFIPYCLTDSCWFCCFLFTLSIILLGMLIPPNGADGDAHGRSHNPEGQFRGFHGESVAGKLVLSFLSFSTIEPCSSRQFFFHLPPPPPPLASSSNCVIFQLLGQERSKERLPIGIRPLVGTWWCRR